MLSAFITLTHAQARVLHYEASTGHARQSWCPRAGADRYIDDGWTALSRAAALGDEAAVARSLEEGALPDMPDGSGYAPLARAVHGGHFNAARALLKAGAWVHLTSGDGASPLEIAARAGDTRLVQLLLNASAKARPGFASETGCGDGGGGGTPTVEEGQEAGDEAMLGEDMRRAAAALLASPPGLEGSASLQLDAAHLQMPLSVLSRLETRVPFGRMAELSVRVHDLGHPPAGRGGGARALHCYSHPLCCHHSSLPTRRGRRTRPPMLRFDLHYHDPLLATGGGARAAARGALSRAGGGACRDGVAALRGARRSPAQCG